MSGGLRWTWVLVVWTLLVWAQRVVNVFGDDDLDTAQRASGALVAALFLVLAAVIAVCLLRNGARCRPLVDLLALAGVLRWTIRTPIVLLESEWSGAFKAVHTVLWLVTLVLSVLAWREVREAAPNPSVDVGAR